MLSRIFLIFYFVSSDGGKTLTYFNYDYSGDFQTVTFEGPEIRKIFYGSFHKVSNALSVCIYTYIYILYSIYCWPSKREVKNKNKIKKHSTLDLL